MRKKKCINARLSALEAELFGALPIVNPLLERQKDQTY